jgi:hypothetical protein
MSAVGPNVVSSGYIARELSSVATGHGVGSTDSSLGDLPSGSDALAQPPGSQQVYTVREGFCP